MLILLVSRFRGFSSTPLEYTPKPSSLTGYKWIPFIKGLGDCQGCALGSRIVFVPTGNYLSLLYFCYIPT